MTFLPSTSTLSVKTGRSHRNHWGEECLGESSNSRAWASARVPPFATRLCCTAWGSGSDFRSHVARSCAVSPGSWVRRPSQRMARGASALASPGLSRQQHVSPIAAAGISVAATATADRARQAADLSGDLGDAAIGPTRRGLDLRFPLPEAGACGDPQCRPCGPRNVQGRFRDKSSDAK